MALKQQKIVGIDIGAHSIQMVSGTGKGTVSKVISVDLPDRVVTNMQISVPDLLTQALKQAKKSGRISGSKCALCLGGSDVIIRHLVLPYMNDEQIYQNVINEISSYLPVDTTKYSIDYSVQEAIATEGATQLKVMVVAISKELLKDYINVLKNAGLKVVYVDIMENAQEKLIRILAPRLTFPTPNFAIMDIGSETTNITAYQNGRFFVNKVVNSGGNQLSERMAERLNIDLLTAEATKRTTDLLSHQGDPDGHMVVAEFVDQLVFEAIRVFDYFKSRNASESIDQLFLCGGTSMLPGIKHYIEDSLHMNITLLEDMMPMLFAAHGAQNINYSLFAGAIGATFREVN